MINSKNKKPTGNPIKIDGRPLIGTLEGEPRGFVASTSQQDKDLDVSKIKSSVDEVDRKPGEPSSPILEGKLDVPMGNYEAPKILGSVVAGQAIEQAETNNVVSINSRQAPPSTGPHNPAA